MKILQLNNSSLQDFTVNGIMCCVYSPFKQNEPFDEILKSASEQGEFSAG